MEPEGQPQFRVAVLGRKRLPEVRDHERVWGFIESIVEAGEAVSLRTLERLTASVTPPIE